jgi:hypothetical protein
MTSDSLESEAPDSLNSCQTGCDEKIENQPLSDEIQMNNAEEFEEDYYDNIYD